MTTSGTLRQRVYCRRYAVDMTEPSRRADAAPHLA